MVEKDIKCDVFVLTALTVKAYSCHLLQAADEIRVLSPVVTAAASRGSDTPPVRSCIHCDEKKQRRRKSL